MRRRLALPLALAALLAVPAAAFGWGNVFRPVPHNPADRFAALPIDGYAYDYAKRCLKRPQPGTLALQRWMDRNAGGVTWGIMRCEKWGKNSASLHAEGRALDWHLSARVPAERREAERIINLLLAPDNLGNPHALARRMGIQEIIFNCRSWWAGQEAMGKYSLCYDRKGKPVKIDDTNAHRDHVHLGLNWAGARMKTTFWAAQAARH